MKFFKTKAWRAIESQVLAPLKIWHVLHIMIDNCHHFEEKDHFLHLFLAVSSWTLMRAFLTSSWRK